MTEEVPFRYAARLYRNRGAQQIAGDLFRLAALRQSTFPIGEGYGEGYGENHPGPKLGGGVDAAGGRLTDLINYDRI